MKILPKESCIHVTRTGLFRFGWMNQNLVLVLIRRSNASIGSAPSGVAGSHAFYGFST